MRPQDEKPQAEVDRAVRLAEAKPATWPLTPPFVLPIQPQRELEQEGGEAA